MSGRREIMTRDGGPGVIEANLNTAVQQGRISEKERAGWADAYQREPYEQVTAALLKRPATNAVAAAAQPASEAAVEAYMRQTFARKPWE
jgi:hypothetical protein